VVVLTGTPIPYKGYQASILFPNAPSVAIGAYWMTQDPVTHEIKPTPVPPDDYISFSMGKLYYSIYGKITYTDIFGVVHWATFCNNFGQPEAILAGRKCVDEYNDVDNNDG
jgi:hypothetical protein